MMPRKIQNRRRFLSQASAALCVCGLCTSTRPLGAEESMKGWSYEGSTGPDKWPDLNPEYAACGIGKEQSPIDLTGAIPAALPDPALAWRPIPLKVTNNGHTIQVDGGEGNLLILDGQAYELVQFHFHHPSEHKIDGKAAAMEVHFVHKASDDSLAVLAALIMEGPANPVIETIWQNIPAKTHETMGTALMIDARPLLPTDPMTYRYAGSLSTPPCSEVVQWAVYRKPITASDAQIKGFAQLYPSNIRPIQPLGRRKLLLDAL